ncbi:hypothetical protein cypCar_00017262 [Cyprinus carpio]|nr:hypothetical protein cypCar_00017262 [Cyprinus carpio]
MPGADPCWSLRKYINFALWIAEWAFTVEEAESSPGSSHVVAARTRSCVHCEIKQRVHGDLHLGYRSIMNSTGFCHSTFPIKSSVMSQLVVWLNVSNTLGIKTSGPHTINLINIVKPSMPEILNVSCSSRWCSLHIDNHSMNLVEIQYSAVNVIWDTFQELNISDAKGKIQRYNISVLEQKGKSNSIIAVPPSRNQSICCYNCSVSVSAVNSEGQSPVKIIQLRLPGLQPQECYQGAVTALRSSGPKMATIKGISSWQSAPEQGPDPELHWKKTESSGVAWSEIPQKKRRGCLKKYTVYLMDNLKGDIHNFTEKMLSLVILAGGAVLLACLILLCICQFSSVHRRFLCCCQCLLPIIPDPANSKCAKTYADDQSEIKFYLDQWDSSVNEEPDNVEVEEVPYPSICTYIKSFSQESSSSDATQFTRITDIMEDYISTHGAISGGEEEDEYEKGERSLDEFEFFPSTHSPFLEPLVLTGGKLTLDVVKIDCSEFLDCT